MRRGADALLARQLYRRLLRIGDRLDADPFLRSCVADRPLQVFDPKKDRWEPAPGAFRDPLREKILCNRRFGASPGTTAGIRLHFRRAIEAGGDSDPRALLSQGFEQLRWLAAAVSAGEELRELARQAGIPPVHTRELQLVARGAAKDAAPDAGAGHDAPAIVPGMGLIAHPLAWSRLQSLRHSVSVITASSGGVVDGLLLNEPSGFMVRDLLEGGIPGEPELRYDESLRRFADRPLLYGGRWGPRPAAKGAEAADAARRRVELHVLHPYGEVEGSVMVCDGVWRWGDIAQMAAMCDDPSHPATPEDFHFLKGSLQWSTRQLSGKIAQGQYVAVDDMSRADVPLSPAEVAAVACRESPHAAWHRMCSASTAAAAWTCFPNYRDQGVHEAVSRYVAELEVPTAGDYDGAEDCWAS